LNYLCPGYKRFFHHVDPYMKIMTDLLKQERPPALIMDILRQRERRSVSHTVERKRPLPLRKRKEIQKIAAPSPNHPPQAFPP